MLFRASQDAFIKLGSTRYLERNLIDEQNLVKEPRIDASRPVDPLENRGIDNRRAQRLLHLDKALLGGDPRLLDEGVEIFTTCGLTVPVEQHALLVDGSHRLAERLGEVAPKRHRLTDRFHRCREDRIGRRELLKGETGHLHDDVVERRLKARRRRARDVIGNLIERVANGETCGDLGNRKACGL